MPTPGTIINIKAHVCLWSLALLEGIGILPILTYYLEYDDTDLVCVEDWPLGNEK
jgi:hypothetical protein